jgi:nucleotide-binding universal stress UspA family protein
MEHKSIVCGVTASTRARRAALDAARLARRTGANLTYVHVVDVSFLQEQIADSLSRAFVEDSLLRLGMQIVEHAAQIAITEEVTAEKHLSKGAVVKCLHKVARDLGADILVLGGEGGRTVYREVLKLAAAEELPSETEFTPRDDDGSQQATQG